MNETRCILSIDVTDTIVGWVCRKRLLVHDTPDGCLELRVANISQRVITHQNQNKAHLSLKNYKPLQHGFVRRFT